MRAALVAAILAGCGARSGLDHRPEDAGPDAVSPECRRDRDCDDAVDCTLDRCRGGRCVAEPEDARCDDGLFCTGPARCDVLTGCVRSPPSCDDGVACTDDACDEALRACVHEPEASRCAISHRCDAARGCVARALVHDDEALWEVDLPDGALRRVAPTDIPLTDLALHPDGALFGVNREGLFRIDERTGRATWLLTIAGMVALEVGPDGALYAAGPRVIVRIDLPAGTYVPVGGFPPGISASGDIAFVGGRMLVTATDTPFSRERSDFLYEAPLDGRDARPVGPIGAPCVWGLAPFGTTLYGLTCTGELVEIDVASGRGRSLRRGLGIAIGGAAAR